MSMLWLMFIDTIEGGGLQGKCSGKFPTLPGYFEIMGFGLPIIMMLALIAAEWRWMRPLIAAATQADIDRAYRYMLKGLVIAICGTLMWVMTETGCDSVPFLRWFPGHIFWHILMPFGLNYLMVGVVFSRADNLGAVARFVTVEESGGTWRCWHHLDDMWPRIVFEFPNAVVGGGTDALMVVGHSTTGDSARGISVNVIGLAEEAAFRAATDNKVKSAWDPDNKVNKALRAAWDSPTVPDVPDVP